MSACLKIDFDYDDAPAAGSDDERNAARSPVYRPTTHRGLAWWHRAIHVVALIGFLGFCAFFCLLWFALATEAG